MCYVPAVGEGVVPEGMMIMINNNVVSVCHIPVVVLGTVVGASRHLTPTSSEWEQTSVSEDGHDIRNCSDPVHMTESKRILPVPSPNTA